MGWVMACIKGKRVMREGERERRRWSLRETERTTKKQKEEKGRRLSVLSSKVERNLIERLD